MLLPSTSLRRMLQSHLHSLRLNRLVTTTSPTKYAHHSARTTRTVDRVTDVQELCERMKEIHWKTKEGGGGDDEDDAIITGLRPFLLPASFKRHFGSDAGYGQRGRVDLLASCNTEMGMNKLLDAMEQCTTATVSVEMGGTNYMDKTMELVDIPIPYFAAYLRLLVEEETAEEETEEEKEEEKEGTTRTTTTPNVYLAQVDLAEKIKILQSSRTLPLALRCGGVDDDGGGGGGGGGASLVDESMLRADIYAHACWIGPSATHSPFHVDPHHNCFEQHRGQKLFRLIHPTDAVDVRLFFCCFFYKFTTTIHCMFLASFLGIIYCLGFFYKYSWADYFFFFLTSSGTKIQGYFTTKYY